MFKKVWGLVSDALTYGASSMLGQILSFLLLPLYTRYLTPEDYGIIALLTIVITLFTPLANLGMTNAIFRRFNTSKTAQERRNVLSTGLYSVLVSSLLLTLTGLTILAEPITNLLLEDLAYTWLMQLAILTGTFNTVGQVPNVILRADRRVKIAATLNVITLFINIVITIALVVSLQMGVAGVIIANLISSIITLFLRFIFVRRQISLYFELYIWRRMLTYGLPFLPHRLQSIGLAQFGVFLIAEVLGKHDAGLYSIAIRISMPMTFVVGAIQKAWVPYKFQIHAEDDAPEQFFRSTVTYYIAAITYLWLGVSLWGPEVVRLLTTPEFHDAALLVPFVALIPFAMGGYFMFGTGIELSDNTLPMPVVSLAGLITVIATSVVLMPALGALGAALATSLGWVIMAASIYYFSQKRFSIDYEWRTIGLILTLAAALVMFGLWLSGLVLPWRISYSLVSSLAFPLLALWIILQTSAEHERVLHTLAALRGTLMRRLFRKARGR
jgi:O-antigen/teichoic acid export membrane protein